MTTEPRGSRTESNVDEALDQAARGASLETDEAGDGTSETDAIGLAAGLVNREDKAFRGIEEVERRDPHRWELDPASKSEAEAGVESDEDVESNTR